MDKINSNNEHVIADAEKMVDSYHSFDAISAMLAGEMIFAGKLLNQIKNRLEEVDRTEDTLDINDYFAVWDDILRWIDDENKILTDVFVNYFDNAVKELQGRTPFEENKKEGDKTNE